MRTDQAIIKHCCGYDSQYVPIYDQYTASRVVVFPSSAMTEKGHHKSSTVVYFFPAFSRLTDSRGNTIAFSAAGIVPGDRLYIGKQEENSGIVMKVTPYLTGSDKVEHYRLECMA